VSGALIQAPRGLTADMARQQLVRGYPFRFFAGGGSMWPLIRSGAELEVLPCAYDDIRAGDVVLIAPGDKLILHRVIEAAAERVQIQGDARAGADGWFSRSAVLGRLPRQRWDPVVARLTPRLGRTLGRCANLIQRFFDRP
jgi:hypothetical protein